MKLNQLRDNPGARKNPIRIGRGIGSGKGKTGGRGGKGQTARTGVAINGFEGGQMPLHRRIPKRGFTNAPFRKEFSTINVSDLAKFEKGSKVGPQELLDSGVVRKLATHGLRVLGDGEVDRALHVSAHHFTKGAREKITKAGGTV